MYCLTDIVSQATSLCMTPAGYLTVKWLPGPGYSTVHDCQGQDTSLCMALWTRTPHCQWLPVPGYLPVHGSLGQDNSLCMIPRAKISHCTMTPRARLPYCAWLPGQGYLPGYHSVGHQPSHPQWEHFLAKEISYLMHDQNDCMLITIVN